jgi:hypothetical protein
LAHANAYGEPPESPNSTVIEESENVGRPVENST